MNQYMYKINLISRLNSDEVWTREDNLAVSAHYNHLKTLTEEGVVLLAGRTNREYEDGFGIVIFKASDWDAAVAFMYADPAIEKGVMHGTLYEYRVALESLSKKGEGSL